MPEVALLICAAILIFTAISSCIRLLGQRAKARRDTTFELGNREYKVIAKGSGEVYSEVIHKECDVSRRAYDPMDPCGRILYVVDVSDGAGKKTQSWPVTGNFPQEKFGRSRIERCDDSLKITNETSGVRLSFL